MEKERVMDTRYFVDEVGRYLGAFAASFICGEIIQADPPEGAIEVPVAPSDARQVWNGEAWSDVQQEATQ